MPEPTPLELLDADQLFARFFRPWRREAPAASATSTLRPDLLLVPGWRGRSASELSLLTHAMQEKVTQQIAQMLAAARSDWQEFVAPYDVLSRDGLLAIDAHFSSDYLRHLLSTSDPTDLGNDLVVLICELGVVLGEALRAARPSLQWVADWPYWDSTLVETRTGHVLAPFQWAMRRFSRTGADDSLLGRVGTCLGILAEPPR